MQRVFQAGMDACDALGVQSAWFFLAIGGSEKPVSPYICIEYSLSALLGFIVGPLALLVSAVQDPTILTSLKRSQRAAFAT